MTVAVDIKEDPGHPQGGHALVLFRDVSLDRSTAKLAIESLTDGFDYRGPRRVDVPVRATGDGVEVSVGPDVVGSLKQGVAVNLSFVGTKIDADVLWPILTPMRAAPRRRAMQTAAPRRVVDTGHPPDAFVAATALTARQEPTEVFTADKPLETKTVAETDAPTKPSEQRNEAAGLTSNVDAAPGATDRGDQPEDAKEKSLVTVPPPPAGLRTPAVVAIAFAAFVIGAGTTGLFWIMLPAPVPRLVTATADVPLPSPYELLNDLSDHAPDGSAVDVGDPSSFRHRSETAASAQDASFWRRWAARRLLDSKTNDAAAILSDFATDLVQTRTDKPDLAAARFVWEMAAIAKDCAAMNNIATALDISGKKDGPEDPAIWRKRAESCRSQIAPKH